MGQIAGFATTDLNERHAFVWTEGNFVDIGTLEFDNASEGLSINRRGVVVGDSYENESIPHAFRWNGKISPLDKIDMMSLATSINDSGEIVGWTSQTDEDHSIAVRFDRCQAIALSGETTNLDDWNLQIATAIRDDGVIVGSGTRSSDEQEHAFMLVPQGSPSAPATSEIDNGKCQSDDR